MLNKDMLRLVFANKKRFLALKQVKFIEVPLYDELSVRRLYPKLKQLPEFQQYFPDKLPNNRFPDRVYMFNVLNTTHHEYCQKLVSHANKQRATASEGKAESNEIKVSEEWYNKLTEIPFISSK